MRNIRHEPVIKFLSVGLVLYLGWLGLYEWWIHPMEWVDMAVIRNTLSLSQKMLAWLGYETAVTGDRMLSVKGTPGLFIGDSCNGISLFALFSIFIVSFPGRLAWKFIFIPAGIFIIHLLNVSRVILLAIIETYSYEWTEFNHTYTFTILIYGFIFLAWLFWINKFSGMNPAGGAAGNAKQTASS